MTEQEQEQTQEQEEKEEIKVKERPSSIHQLQALIKRHYPERKEKVMRIKDPTQEAIELHKEFVNLVASLNVEFFVHLLECEVDLYIIAISEYDLAGGAKLLDGRSVGERVELRAHSWKQRTYSYQAENKRATWAVFTQIAEYPYIVEVPPKLAMLGKKKEVVKFAPVVWVSSSDGQCEEQDETMRRASHRAVPTQSDILNTQLIYGVNVATKLLESNKLLAQKVKQKDISYEEIMKEADNYIKHGIAKGLQMAGLIGRPPRTGISAYLVSLMSNRAVRYVVYLIGLFLILITISYIASIVTGAPFILDPAGTGGEVPTGNPDAVTGPVGEGTP